MSYRALRGRGPTPHRYGRRLCDAGAYPLSNPWERPPRKTLRDCSYFLARPRLSSSTSSSPDNEGIGSTCPLGSGMTRSSTFDCYLEPIVRDLAKLRDDMLNLREADWPSEECIHQWPRLTDWSYGSRPAPCLVGTVDGHALIRNGTRVHTSEIVLVDPALRWARTWTKFYRLGQRGV